MDPAVPAGKRKMEPAVPGRKNKKLRRK